MTNAVYHVFVKEPLNFDGVEVAKDEILEVHPIKENYSEAEFLVGDKVVVARYDAVMRLTGLKSGMSVVGNRVAKTSNFDHYGFPMVELAEMDE